MILHFHASDTLPGESSYFNLCTERESYNFNIYQHSHYIEVSRKDLDAIYKECDFNMWSHSEDLLAENFIDGQQITSEVQHDQQITEEEEKEDLPWY